MSRLTPLAKIPLKRWAMGLQGPCYVHNCVETPKGVFYQATWFGGGGFLKAGDLSLLPPDQEALLVSAIGSICSPVDFARICRGS